MSKPGDQKADDELQSFSLVLGGPFYQLLRRSHLTGDTLEHAQMRVVTLALLAWLPLCLIELIKPGPPTTITFWQDLELHARLLLALPILVAAELVIHRSIRPLLQTFLDRKLVPEDSLEKFHSYVHSAMRARNSYLAELLLVAIVYGLGVTVVWRHGLALDTPSWYFSPAEGGELTLAGTWFAWVSLPMFQFLMLRWYYRWGLWTRLLWQVSRLPLNLVATHPDGSGGLGFLARSANAFAPLAAANGALLAGMIANRIFFADAKLTDFKLEIGAMVAFMICLCLGSLLAFIGPLMRVRFAGLASYGRLAQRYVTDFDRKWIQDGAPDETLLGSADIQSLADLSGAYEVIRSMSIVPFNRRSVLSIAGATLAPIAPLVLTMMPLEKLLEVLVGVVL
jgi:hypothetical protein